MNLCTTFNLPPGCSLADIDPDELAERQERLERREQERSARRRDDEMFNDRNQNQNRNQKTI